MCWRQTILAVSILYYVPWSTPIWLKPRTPQNIVIGGGGRRFSAADRLGCGDGRASRRCQLILFAIIFMWTPPHFWALALFVKTDYAKVGIPMMPVVAGEALDAAARSCSTPSLWLLAAFRAAVVHRCG